MTETKEDRGAVQVLSYLGLFPFIICLLSSLVTNDSTFLFYIRFVTICYAGLVLTFIGAIHWGFFIQNKKKEPLWKYVIAVIPVIISITALLLPSQYSFGLLFFSFIVLHRYEKHILWQDYFSESLQTLRSRLSFYVSSILLVIWLINL